MSNAALTAAIVELSNASGFRGGNKSPVVLNGLASAINLRSEQGAYYTSEARARAEANIAAALKAVR